MYTKEQVQDFRKQMYSCTFCHLRGSNRHPVPLSGSGSILWVGEAPAKEELIQGLPFCGPSGKILEKTTQEIGIDIRTQCCITNTVLCFLSGNRTPTPKEASICKYRWLDKTIQEVIQPKVIVLLGRVAQEALIPYTTMINGSKVIFEGREYLFIYHPSFWLRNGGEVWIKANITPVLTKEIQQWKEKGYV